MPVGTFAEIPLVLTPQMQLDSSAAHSKSLVHMHSSMVVRICSTAIVGGVDLHRAVIHWMPIATKGVMKQNSSVTMNTWLRRCK